MGSPKSVRRQTETRRDVRNIGLGGCLGGLLTGTVSWHAVCWVPLFFTANIRNAYTRKAYLKAAHGALSAKCATAPRSCGRRWTEPLRPSIYSILADRDVIVDLGRSRG